MDLRLSCNEPCNLHFHYRFVESAVAVSIYSIRFAVHFKPDASTVTARANKHITTLANEMCKVGDYVFADLVTVQCICIYCT